MKTLTHLKTIVLALVLLVIACTPASAQQRTGLLWKISGKGMSQPAYLFGTVHLYDTSSYQLPRAPFDLLDKVDKVYFELDFGKINPQEMMSAMFIADSSQYINKLLDPASLEKLKRLTASSAIVKMLGDKVYTIKPILLSTLLTNNDGKASSVDLELYKAAVSKNNPVGGLETVKEQMDAFNTISIPAQVDMLRQTLAKNLSPADLLNRLMAVYVKQDIEHMLDEWNDDMPMDANFEEHLLIKRNINMADRIDSLLHKEHPLIAIGAAHLGNSTGLIELLKKKGYTLTNIPFTIKKAHE